MIFFTRYESYEYLFECMFFQYCSFESFKKENGMKKLILACLIFAFTCTSFGCFQLMQENTTASKNDFVTEKTDSIANLGIYTQESFSIDEEDIFGKMDDEDNTKVYFFIHDPIVFKKEKVENNIICTNREFMLCFAVKNVKDIPKEAKSCIAFAYACAFTFDDIESTILEPLAFDKQCPFLNNVRIGSLETIEELTRIFKFYDNGYGY